MSDPAMPLGQPMPDDPTEATVPASVDAMDDDALEGALAVMAGESPAPVDDVAADDLDATQAGESVPVEAEPLAPVAVTATEVAAAAPEAEPEPLDVAAELARERLEREKLSAKLELQQAHNSRLAGEIGFLKNKKPAHARPEPSDEPDAYALDGRSEPPEANADVRERLERLEGRIASEAVQEATQEAVLSAMNDLTSSVKDDKERAELDRHIKALTPRYAKDWKAAVGATDPEIAGALARGTIMNIIADAKIARLDETRDAARQERANAATALRRSKLSAAPTRTTGAPSQASRPRAKTPDDMTEQEADAALAAAGLG